MQAGELRIGNYVKIDELFDINEVITDTDTFPIAMIDEMFVNLYINEDEEEFDLKDINPVSLTKQWLKDFGFEKTYAENCYKISLGEFIQHHLYITISEKYNIVTLGDNYGEKEILMVFTLRISEYVHQLQNLYFALTGTELIYEP